MPARPEPGSGLFTLDPSDGGRMGMACGSTSSGCLELPFKFGNRAREHLAVRPRSGHGQIRPRSRERQLERTPSRSRVAFLNRQRSSAGPGALGFGLLEFDVLAFETSRHLKRSCQF